MRVQLWSIRQRTHLFWLALVTIAFVAAFYVLRDVPTDGGPRKLLYPGNGSLLGLPDFRYRMNSDICSKSNIFLLVFIHSSPAHFYNRETIRKTWGNVQVDGKVVRTVFMIADIRDSGLQEVLESENQRHGDLVQGNFLDSYRNLTYKHVMGLRWLSSECEKATFAIKMDDDIFVDIYRLVRFLEKRYPNGLTTSLGCYLQKGMKVMRDETNKWYVSKSEYSKDTFEDYCSGWAYILSPFVASKLDFTARFFRFFWIDDVYVTGTLANHAGLKRDPINWVFTISTGSLLDWVRGKDKMAWRYLVGPTWGDMMLMEAAHKKAAWCWKNSCPCCYPKKLSAILPHVITNNGSLKGKAEIIKSFS